MDFSGIPFESALGRVLRAPLRWIPSGARVPILQGRLRGRWWIAGSSTHGCWLGSYEIQKRRAFERTIPSGSTVFDVGAHVGFYTLLSSELVGPRGRVVAFEPFPRNLHFLREHLRLNGVRNVEVVEAAVSARSGSVRFAAGPSSTMGRIEDSGDVIVRSLALDELVDDGSLPCPDFLKVDIEGAERHALEGARGILERRGPTIFLATHGAEVHRECCELLRELGYDLASLDGRPVDSTDEILATRPVRG